MVEPLADATRQALLEFRLQAVPRRLKAELQPAGGELGSTG
jgi:hypothetical protein